MADHYAEMAQTYDIMIDWPSRLERERSFFAWLFAGGRVRRALDVGCATGHHARLYAELGAEVVGLDPSLPMLEHARALTPEDNPRFTEGGFADIPALTAPFDLITVLGNTLAHARHARGLRTALRNIRGALAPNGRLLIQVINYDRLRAVGSSWLPPVSRQAQGRDYIFLREHRLLRGRAEFTIVSLFREETWQQRVERSSHLPLTAETLQTALKEAGFTTIDRYGNIQREPFDPANSPNLIIEAAR